MARMHMTKKMMPRTANMISKPKIWLKAATPEASISEPYQV